MKSIIVFIQGDTEGVLATMRIFKVLAAILTPYTLCHTVTHISGPPLKYVTHLGPPIFSSTCIHAYILFREGF